ncbi:MAG: hypothetical protein Q8R76_00315 [Candidatus Omnitrophota bacterium]|nr:hypothetical protein [Candidatus Omnitrophota bacterium]
MKRTTDKPKLFVYKIKVDSGGAPCVRKGLLTLAICKPLIRSAANAGDWIFGFGSNELDNRLIYVAEVTEKLCNGLYYGKVFSGRPDAIYRWKGDQLRPKRNRLYHRGIKDPERDIGVFAHYKRANVLLSRKYRYFGKERYDYSVGLRQFIRSIGRGHRCRISAHRRAQLEDLRKRVWREWKKTGRPTHAAPADRQSVCHADAGSCVLK